jgi:hypothetical protein
MSAIRLSFGCVLLVVLVCAGAVWADGGMFWQQATDLAQTRQTALLLMQADRITYVVQMVYTGQADELAWVLPMPAAPTNVVAHEDDALFQWLDARTRPSFQAYTPAGFGCGGMSRGDLGGIVQVEAEGQAGIYDYAVLTSSGSEALLKWLGDNGFNVPASAGPVLDSYIQQNMHFLAIRVRDASGLGQNGTRGVPPIQFEVVATDWFYPMVISKISAAPQTEVVLYFLASGRLQASNVPNGVIDPGAVRRDPETESGTNYERLFLQEIASLGDLALITEYAGPAGDDFYLANAWPQMPAGVSLGDLTLTRLRTVAAPAEMTKDLLFEPGPDTAVANVFDVSEQQNESVLNVLVQILAALLSGALFAKFCRHSYRCDSGSQR